MKKTKKELIPSRVILNKTLYKTLHRSKANDRVALWNYEKRTREVHSFRTVAQLGERAYNMKEVGELIQRSKQTIKSNLHDLPEPYRIYSFETHKPRGRVWDANGVMEIREVFANKHRGRPRLDGSIRPQEIPSRAELRALLNQEAIFYVQTEDGEFIPTWKAH